MSDMLQHQEFYEQEIKRHQAEAQQWAEAGTLGRLADTFREQRREHPKRTRFFAIASPMAVALGLVVIII